MPTLLLEKIRVSNEESNERKFSQIDWENISLYEFVREFWPVIEPGKPFVDGKHIEAICLHLEAVTDGRITRLLVNMPPRHAKSSIISVLWRVWTWIKKPATRFLCASYALSLSIRDNVKCRRLILSNKFQERYGHIFHLTRDQNAKIKFENDKRGFSQAVSVGSSATGEGGDILLCLCYNAEVTTDRGRIQIGEIVDRRLPVRILAYDHTANIARWQKIEKYEKNPGRACVRVTFTDGRFVDATTDHPFYVVGKGYVQASQLTSTDRVIIDESQLSGLRKRNRSSSCTSSTLQERRILQSCMSRQMANGRKQPRLSGRKDTTDLRFLRQDILPQTLRSLSWSTNLLLSCLQSKGEASQSTSQSYRQLCSLWQGNQTARSCSGGKKELLLSHVCQSSTQSTYQWREQSSLCGWNGDKSLSPRVFETFSSDKGARRPQMPDMRHDPREKRQGLGCSPYRLRYISQRSDQSCLSLPMVSRKNAWNGRGADASKDVLVGSVEPIATPEYVYNLRIAEDHNYFASGVLVHNCDDPHAIDEKRSDVTREAALDWFKDTWCTRLNDQNTGAMVVVGQRVHGQDLSGYILSGDTGEHWVHLNLPTEFEPDNRCVTSSPDGTFKWSDWRVLEGDLLWPERFGEKVIERAKRRHGPQGFAALFQQRPVPLTGNLFDIGNERLFTIDREAGLYLLETPRGIKPIPIKDCYHFTDSDVAAKAKEQNDWTVFSTWSITPDLDILLVDLKRGHWTIPEQAQIGFKTFREFNSDSYQCVYFEDVGYQSAIGQEMISLGAPCLPFQPEGDKVLRAGAASIWQRLGKLYFLKFARWLEEFRKELYLFPKGEHDDQVDTVSMAVLIVRRPSPLSETRSQDDDIPPAAEETLAPVGAQAVPLAPSSAFVDPFGGDW